MSIIDDEWRVVIGDNNHINQVMVTRRMRGGERSMITLKHVVLMMVIVQCCVRQFGDLGGQWKKKNKRRVSKGTITD